MKELVAAIPKSELHNESRSDARVTLAAVGDIVMDRAVQVSAKALMDPAIVAPHLRVASGPERLFEGVKHSLADADIVFANLETPIASGLSRTKCRDADGRLVHKQISPNPQEVYDGKAYTGAAFSFNAHPALALALKNTGFNIVSTANNHSLDRGSNGVDLTIDALREAGIDHIGTRRSTESSPDAGAPHAVKTVKGVRIAFFAWTLPLNSVGGPWGSKDRLHQVKTLMSPPSRYREHHHQPGGPAGEATERNTTAFPPGQDHRTDCHGQARPRSRLGRGFGPLGHPVCVPPLSSPEKAGSRHVECGCGHHTGTPSPCSAADREIHRSGWKTDAGGLQPGQLHLRLLASVGKAPVQ
jgi:hypothetical protein